METLNELEQLDRVLSILKDSKLPLHSLTVWRRCSIVFNCTEREIDAIIDKLCDDGFVEKITSNTGGEMFKIKHNGSVFNGYVNANNFNVSENIRLENVENAQMENERQVTFLTRIIAVGTLVAAIYYGVEIYKEFHAFFHRHGLFWIWETIPKK